MYNVNDAEFMVNKIYNFELCNPSASLTVPTNTGRIGGNFNRPGNSESPSRGGSIKIPNGRNNNSGTSKVGSNQNSKKNVCPKTLTVKGIGNRDLSSYSLLTKNEKFNSMVKNCNSCLCRYTTDKIELLSFNCN